MGLLQLGADFDSHGAVLKQVLKHKIGQAVRDVYAF